MDMIRWLATNKVVLTVWGLGILAILLASIFGGGKEVEHAAAPVKAKAVEVVADKAKAVPAAVEVVADKAKAAVEVVAEKVKEAPAVVTAATGVATAAVVSTVQAAVDTSVEAAPVVSTEPSATDSVEKVADVVVASEEKVVESTDSTASSDQAVAVKEDSIADKSSDDLLMMAREAYWNNGLDKAASLYSELITREPTVIEHKGELGNVFWRQGYPKKAAELYSDIAEPMIEKGNGERVSNMVGFIGLFFPERATSIRKLLDAQ